MEPAMRSALIVIVSMSIVTALTDVELKNLTRNDKGEVTIVKNGDEYVITSDGTPDHDTADFPTSYNPNEIKAQSHEYTLPANPTDDEENCLPMGAIGISVSGVPFFNPFTAEGNNAVEGEHAEEFDTCDGHPARSGDYHYHKEPSCIPESKEWNQIVGVAFDGLPVYSKYDATGKKLTSADLDKCHGRFVDGKYRYHLTEDYPYILGCFKGEIVDEELNKKMGSGQCQTAISDEADSTGDGDGDGAASIVPMASSLMMVVLTYLCFYWCLIR